MTHDSELDALAAKIKQLTKDRDAAMRMAERAVETANLAKTDAEHYKRLWEEAAHRAELLDRMNTPRKKQKRDLEDWIWTGVFAAAVAALAYLIVG